MLCEVYRQGVSYLVFEELESIPGFLHAFTTRRTDDGDFAQAGSEKERFLKALGVPRRQLIPLQQSHSDRVIIAEESACGGESPCVADGVIITAPEKYAVIQTADCLPVIAVEPRARALCAIHAGWRGTRARIVEKGIQSFLKLLGTSVQDLRIAFGPCIRSCCYRVGDEVRNDFQREGHPVEQIFQGNRLDLSKANRLQLSKVGVNDVLDCGLCTACDSGRFYSYRREGHTGRMWALAGFGRR
ncbi:MAG: peptidoglycan editing factor PgeF [Acidobacteria bacterium]|nr:peptidoglycan editing factor PgeF [Acidobacteriota bacterium]